MSNKNMEKSSIFSKMTYGLYVLTSACECEINGMIASWVSQVSYSPHQIMAAVHPNRYCHHLIEKSGFFALNILSENQNDFIKRFKGADAKAKFNEPDWRKGITGCPVLISTIGYAECRVIETINPGNHTLFIGEVLEAKCCIDGDPLKTCDYSGVYIGNT